jgi:hypothetical protein
MRDPFPDLPPRLRKPRLAAPEASDYLAAAHGVRIATSTLAKLRSRGGGPRFSKFGAAVLYARADLDEWVTSRLREGQSGKQRESAA